MYQIAAAVYAAGIATAPFSMADVLSYPFPAALVASADGGTIAYLIEQRGTKTIWLARAPQYSPRQIVAYLSDDGNAVSSLQLSRNGAYVVYVRGDAENPTANVEGPHVRVWSVRAADGARAALGDGSDPVISPDVRRVAFVNDGRVMVAPIDGSAPARPLFSDLGRDSDLRWSPDGRSLAFVSSRDDHAFIGVYRDGDPTLQFLAPSVGNDTEPRWSADGTRIAFARAPGSGGAAPSPLKMPVVPWSICVARVSDGATHVVWRSPNTSRASFPTQGGDVDLTWAGANRFLFLDSMDDWSHIYEIGSGGGALRRLTTGSFDVTEVAVTSDGRFALYTANAGTRRDDIDRWHIYRVNLDSGQTAALTSGYGSQWSPTPLADGATAYVTATARRPPLVAVRANGGDTLLDGALLPREFPEAQLVTPREVTYRSADGVLVHAQLFARDGTGRMPAVVFVHGGPMRQMLLTWMPMDYYDNSYAVNQYLASRGFAVLSINYRSGVGYGHDFHYATRTGWTGASEYRDVLAGARWLQRQRFVDGAHVGIWGGSWGGYLTALALARNSDVFKAGVDFSGVYDLMHDAVEYFRDFGEGTLDVDVRPWLRLAWNSSPVAAVSRWRSPVLLIQGDADPEVSFHQLVDLVPRLERYRVPFQTIVLANEGHGFLRWASWLRTDRATAAFLQRYL